MVIGEWWLQQNALSATRCVTEQWLQWAVSTEHRPECKLQTVNAKSKPNNYRSSAERWSVVEPNRAEVFGRTFGRCSALTELRCTYTARPADNCWQTSFPLALMVTVSYSGVIKPKAGKARQALYGASLLPRPRRLCFRSVCLFVCLLAGLRKNYWTNFYQIQWLKWGGLSPLLPFEPPAIVWAPMIESIKCYFMPK